MVGNKILTSTAYAAVPVTIITVSDSLASTVNNGNATPIEIYSGGVQLAATIGGINPATTLLIAPHALTVTTAKIVIDANEGREIQSDDIISRL